MTEDNDSRWQSKEGPAQGGSREGGTSEGKGWEIADKATTGCMTIAAWIGAVLCLIVAVILFQMGEWIYGLIFTAGVIALAATGIRRK